MNSDEQAFIRNFIAPERRARMLAEGLADRTYDIEQRVDASKAVVLSGCKWTVLCDFLQTLTAFGPGRVVMSLCAYPWSVVDLADEKCVFHLQGIEGLVLFQHGEVALLCSEFGVDWQLFIQDPALRNRVQCDFDRFKQQQKHARH